MPSYTVVDAKLTHDARRWRFEAGVRNLFARQYYSYGVFFTDFFTGTSTFAALPAPERSLFASVRYTLQ
jgi:outer membrane receptor protein involved in Fe transport